MATLITSQAFSSPTAVFPRRLTLPNRFLTTQRSSINVSSYPRSRRCQRLSMQRRPDDAHDDNLPEILREESMDKKPGNSPLAPLWDIVAGVQRFTRLILGIEESVDDGDLGGFEVERDSMFEEGEVQEVLVVGATGETGRIIVRKLLLRGFKVRVLVRNLYSSTLDLLGTGVSFVKGHLSDYFSLSEAVGGVDKIICAVRAADAINAREVEYEGVRNLLRAFHDSRQAYYGRAEATKILLFNFHKDSHRQRWRPYAPLEQQRAVVAGVAKSAEIRPPRLKWQKTASDRTAFLGQVYDVYNGEAEIRCVPANFNLRGFSGLIVRCVGDGKSYSIILRTPAAMRMGAQYVKVFPTTPGRWQTVRLPFSEFKPKDAKTGSTRRDAPELDRRQIKQIAINFAKPEESPEKDDGKFYLAMEYIKIYRTQEEPDFVLVSCASVSSRDFSELDEKGKEAIADDDSTAWKYLSENAVKNSGLTYCIVRPGQFTDQPGGNKALVLEQNGDVSGAISRADVAEICVKSLLDPRACNVTFDAFESMYAPTAKTPSQDLSSLLGRLRPNT